jgi:hypothetical protein
VSTFVYAHLLDDDQLGRLVSASQDAGAAVTRVQLAPSTEALEARVSAADRSGTNKVTDPAVVRRLMFEFDLRPGPRR